MQVSTVSRAPQGTKTPPFKRAIVQSIGYGATPTADEAEAVFSQPSLYEE